MHLKVLFGWRHHSIFLGTSTLHPYLWSTPKNGARYHKCHWFTIRYRKKYIDGTAMGQNRPSQSYFGSSQVIVHLLTFFNPPLSLSHYQTITCDIHFSQLYRDRR